MKGKIVMKKILAKKILKQCFISSWRISRVFSATVYSHLLVCKKQVTAALLSKLRINKMKSPVNMFKIQISGNFQHPALAFRTKTRMKNVRKLLIKIIKTTNCNWEILWSVRRLIAWDDISITLRAIKTIEKMEFQTCIKSLETQDFLEAKIISLIQR